MERNIEQFVMRAHWLMWSDEFVIPSDKSSRFGEQKSAKVNELLDDIFTELFRKPGEETDEMGPEIQTAIIGLFFHLDPSIWCYIWTGLVRRMKDLGFNATGTKAADKNVELMNLVRSAFGFKPLT